LRLLPDISKTVIPAKAGIQYAAAHRVYGGRARILDHPLSRMMTINKNDDQQKSRRAKIAPAFGFSTFVSSAFRELP
jgi:hypothetical protein